MMQDAGIRPLGPDKRKEDPFFAHFPGLRTMLRDSLQGRNYAVLRRRIENDNFFSQWDIEMRYCKGSDINPSWINNWKDQANDVVNCIGT
jgi:hypothetical protein